MLLKLKPQGERVDVSLQATHLPRNTRVLFICFQASTCFPSEGQGWIPASAEHIYTVKRLQLSAAYFADVQHLSLHRSSALWAVTSGMGEGVLYLVINLLMLCFLTFTPVFPPFAACSIDYQLTVINIYWTAALLHSCQIGIQPKLQGETCARSVMWVWWSLSPRLLHAMHLYLWIECQRNSFLKMNIQSSFQTLIVSMQWKIVDHQLSSSQKRKEKKSSINSISFCSWRKAVMLVYMI